MTRVTLRAGRARGRLVGGNLALVAALVGTPYAPDLDGAILVLEDVNEAVYRIDRMLTQLALSGALSHAPESCSDDSPNSAGCPATTRGRSSAMQEVADRCGMPCIVNAPFGHVDDQFTLPLGATACSTRINEP